jgi:hypothetical protein
VVVFVGWKLSYVSRSFTRGLCLLLVDALDCMTIESSIPTRFILKAWVRHNQASLTTFTTGPLYTRLANTK